jgi:hypothetical protein
MAKKNQRENTRSLKPASGEQASFGQSFAPCRAVAPAQLWTGTARLSFNAARAVYRFEERRRRPRELRQPKPTHMPDFRKSRKF